MTVGECIRTLRASAGLTQGELAARAGISASLLSLLESDSREPTLRALRDISRGLRLPANVLFAVALGASSDFDDSSEIANARDLTESLIIAAQELLLRERLSESTDRKKDRPSAKKKAIRQKRND
jgi:Predicted transcriptional regulator with C-terminal CBS domains